MMAQDIMAHRPTIELKKFTGADVNLLIDWIPSAEFMLQWGGPVFSYPLTRKQLKNLLSAAATPRPNYFLYKAVDIADGRAVGYGELAAVDYRNSKASLARILIGPPERRGQGLGGLLVRELLRIAFQEVGLHRVELRVYDFNLAAIRCYERAGFKKEGLMREVTRCGDLYWNAWLMSILDREWRGK